MKNGPSCQRKADQGSALGHGVSFLKEKNQFMDLR